jgi:hypothetical protein
MISRRTLFKRVAAAMAGSLLARMPFVGSPTSVPSTSAKPWRVSHRFSTSVAGAGDLDRWKGNIKVPYEDIVEYCPHQIQQMVMRNIQEANRQMAETMEDRFFQPISQPQN